MALTAQQDIPKKSETQEPWTFRRLFPLAGAVTSITKVFVNPFDILLGFLVLVVGIAELIGHQVSWMLWVLTVLILIADITERRGFPFVEKEVEITKKDKK